MDKILKFENKTEYLTLEELNATSKIKNANGKTIVEPQRVYADVIGLLNKHNIAYELNPIVAKGGVHALYNSDLAEYIGTEHHIKAYTLLRTSGIITFKSFEDTETTLQLRIDVTEQGITLSVGKLVLICTNGMTAFRGDIASTYGNNKVLYEQSLQLVENWIINLADINVRYNNVIIQMKQLPVPIDEFNMIIGKLLFNAVDGNRNNKLAPLNITQVSAFTNSYIESLSQEDKVMQINNVWDLYNAGTELLKHDKMDMSIIADRNLAFTEFICNEYAIELNNF